ncbi:MAG: DUF4215 domain-containing protein [bacterium]|nr:DUF4215 domain-containing protein [bacterium]
MAFTGRYRMMEWRFVRLMASMLIVMLFFASLFPLAKGADVGISIRVMTTPPQLSLVAVGDTTLEVHWHWDFVSPGYIPLAITQIDVELSSDGGLNYFGLQSHAPGDFLATYLGLAPETYIARVKVLDGNDYDYVVGPVVLGGGAGDGRPRGNPPPPTVEPPPPSPPTPPEEPPPPATITVIGLAYPGPNASVYFSLDGVSMGVITPGQDGVFAKTYSGLEQGDRTFRFLGQDPEGRYSIPFEFDYTIIPDFSAQIANINLPPTAFMPRQTYSQGEQVTASGYSYQRSFVTVIVEGPTSIAFLVQADDLGAWSLSFDSTSMGDGVYSLVALSTSQDGAVISPDSESLLFEIIRTVPAAVECGDGQVEDPETCDDGNQVSFDGCSRLCQVERLPESHLLQFTPDVIQGVDVPLTIVFDSLPNGGANSVEVYLGKDGGNFQLIPSTRQSTQLTLTQFLADGVYLGYSRVTDVVGYTEALLTAPDIQFTVHNVTDLSLTAYPEKRFPRTGNWGLASVLNVYEEGATTSVLQENIQTASDGKVFLDNRPLGPGGYLALLKGLSHLTKRLNGLTLSPGGDLLLDFTLGGAFFLLAGDVHRSKDDYVNGLDFSAVCLALYTALIDADLNNDGLVNGLDLSIAVANIYQRGEVI